MKQEISNQSMLLGKLKLWCLQFGLLPRLMWPLAVVDILLTKVEKMERMIGSCVRKWLGAPQCLNNISLYGHGIFESCGRVQIH